MKWLDIFAAWCTTLKDLNENSIDELLKHGQFIAIDQAISIKSTALLQFSASLQRLGAEIDLVQLAQGIQRQHKTLQTPFYLRVEIQEINYNWQKQCRFLFKKRMLLNWRSLLCVDQSRVALEYIGQSWTSMDLLESCNATTKELSIIVFQLLWTFAVLARCETFLQIDNWAHFFSKVYVQRNRTDYFQQSDTDFVFFVREQNLAETYGIYRVPVRQAFVHIFFEPKNKVSFGHQVYKIATQSVPIDNMPCEQKDERYQSLFFANFALQLKKFLFPQDCCSESNTKIFDGLAKIISAEKSVEEFLYGSFANSFFVNLNLQERQSILRVLVSEKTVSVLYLPQKDEKVSLVQQKKFRSDIIGFPNVENNCFLNSVLFMLMFPNDFANSFAETIAVYSDMCEPNPSEVDSVRQLREAISNAEELETMRRILARLFSKILQTAFIASQSGNMQEEKKIQENCSSLLPLLDVWSLASRGQYFAQFVGEYQDLDECLRLLHSLLLFESFCTSTIAITEEFPNLLFENGEKLDIEEMEKLSLDERKNPLCLRVTSCFESPIIRFECSALGSDEKAPIQLQKLCTESQLECSIVPSPLDAASKEIEKQTNVKIPRTTRYNLKKTMRSRGKKMVIFHIFRQNVTFLGDRMIFKVKRNFVLFPENEILMIDGHQMQVQSLALWGSNHYTCLIFCKKTLRWWHVNDMMNAGYRFQDFGSSLSEAIAQLNRLGLLITTINCIAVNESVMEKQLYQQCFVELPKYCFASDTLQGKAILFHKDDKQFLSARSTLLKICEPIFALPDRFLFGYDDPGKDFIFLPSWFNGTPLEKQSPEMCLAVASGFTPITEHSLDLSLNYIKNVETDIAERTSITLQKNIQKAQERAKENLTTISCLVSGAKMTAKQFYSILLALNARACNLNAKKFINATESAGILPRNCTPTFWTMDQSIVDALLNGFESANIEKLMQSKQENQLRNYLALQKLVFPFFVDHSGFVVLVEPQKNQITVFDPFGHQNALILQRVISLLILLEKTTSTGSSATFANCKIMYGTMQPPDHVGCDLIALCVELMRKSADQLQANYDLKKNIRFAATNFSVLGQLKL